MENLLQEGGALADSWEQWRAKTKTESLTSLSQVKSNIHEGCTVAVCKRLNVALVKSMKVAQERFGMTFKQAGTLSPEKFSDLIIEAEKERNKLLKEFLDFGKALLAETLGSISGEAEVQFRAMKKDYEEEWDRRELAWQKLQMVLCYWKTSLRTVTKKEEEENRYWSLVQGDFESITQYHERLRQAQILLENCGLELSKAILFSHLLRSVNERSKMWLSNYCKSSATVDDEGVSFQGMIEHLKQEEIHHKVRFNESRNPPNQENSKSNGNPRFRLPPPRGERQSSQPSQQGQQDRANHQPTPRMQGVKSMDRKLKRCFNCHLEGHLIQDCPTRKEGPVEPKKQKNPDPNLKRKVQFEERKCNFCGKSGHLEEDCFAKKKKTAKVAAAMVKDDPFYDSDDSMDSLDRNFEKNIMGC